MCHTSLIKLDVQTNAVKKMPLIGLTPACPDPPKDYFCACAPAVPSTLTTYFQAPKDTVAIVLPDCKATVANLTPPPQQPPPPSVLEQKFGSALISFKVRKADAADTQVTFCVETDDGTGNGFVFQDHNPDQIWHFSTRSSQPCHMRFKIFTPAGCSPYSEILTVAGSFKAPEQCGHLRLVDPVDLRWQGPDAHSLQMIGDTPASNCDTLVLQYVVSMQLVFRGVELGSVQVVYVGSNPSCRIAGLSPGSSYTCRVSAVTVWGYGEAVTMTFLTQQAPPDQSMTPLIAESAGSSIHLSWVNPARPDGLLIQGFVLEYLVIEDKETHERGSVEVQDIWRECVRIEVRTRTLPLPPTPCHHGVGSGSGGQRKGTRCFQCQCNLFDFTKRAHGARADVRARLVRP